MEPRKTKKKEAAPPPPPPPEPVAQSVGTGTGPNAGPPDGRAPEIPNGVRNLCDAMNGEAAHCVYEPPACELVAPDQRVPERVFHFPVNEAKLTPTEQKSFDGQIRWLADHLMPGTEVTVIGSASLEGPIDHNHQLSCDRAKEIAKQLEEAGIKVKYVQMTGPVGAPNDPARRAVEIHVPENGMWGDWFDDAMWSDWEKAAASTPWTGWDDLTRAEHRTLNAGEMVVRRAQFDEDTGLVVGTVYATSDRSPEDLAAAFSNYTGQTSIGGLRSIEETLPPSGRLHRMNIEVNAMAFFVEDTTNAPEAVYEYTLDQEVRALEHPPGAYSIRWQVPPDARGPLDKNERGEVLLLPGEKEGDPTRIVYHNSVSVAFFELREMETPLGPVDFTPVIQDRATEFFHHSVVTGVVDARAEVGGIERLKWEASWKGAPEPGPQSERYLSEAKRKELEALRSDQQP